MFSHLYPDFLYEVKGGRIIALVFELMGIALIIVIIIIAILLGMFCTGAVVLIIGIVSKKILKKSGVVKKYPKILTVLGSVLMIIPAAIVIAFCIYMAVPSNSGSYKSDDVMYNEMVDEFFAAADVDDAQAMYDLFAASVRAENSD